MSRYCYSSASSCIDNTELFNDEDHRHLENQNATLLKENTLLKAQLESAVDVESRIDGVYKENEKLQSQIMDLSTENQKLKKVIEISQKSYEDQISKVKKDQELFIQQRSLNDEAVKEELKVQKKKMKKELINVLNDNEELCSENNKLNNEFKMVNAKIDKVIKTFSFFYKKKLTSLDELLDVSEEFFRETKEDKKKSSKESKPVKEEQSNAKDYEKLKKHCKAYRNTVKEQEEIIKNLKKELEASKQTEKDNEVSNNTINSLQKKISVYEEDKKLMEEDYEHQIKLLQNKVDLLKSEIDRKNSQPPPEPVILASSIVPSPQPEDIGQSKYANEEESEGDMLFEEINQRNISLGNQLKTVTEMRNELAEKLQEEQESNERIMNENENLKNEIENLASAHEKALEELETYKTALIERSAKINKREKKLMKSVQAETAVKIERLQSETESYKKQLFDNQLEVEKLNQTIVQLTNKNSSLKQEALLAQQNMKKANDEKEYAEKQYKEKPSVTEEDLIPVTAWHFNGFDSQLMQTIDEIGRNQVLHPSSKIQSSFKTIQKFYSKKLNERHQKYEMLNSEYSQLRSFFSNFIVDLSIAALDSTMTYEDFENGDGAVIIKFINEMRSNQDKLLRECESLSKSLASYKKAYGKENPQETADKMHKEFEEKSNMLKKREKCYKKVKSELQHLKEKSGKETADLNSRIQEMNAEIAHLHSENDDISEQLSVTKKKLLSMTNKVREDDMRIESLTLDFQSQINELNKKTIEEKTRIEAEMTDEIRRVTENLTATADNFEGSQQQINQLKKVIATQKIAISELETDRDYKVKQSATDLNTVNKKHEFEKQQIIEKYEQVISQCNQQIKEQQEDLIRMSKELAKSEKNRKGARMQIMDLVNEKNEIVEEMKNAEERFEREKKVIKSNANMAQIATESNFSTKLAEAKTQMDSEKHDIFSFVCNEFRDNFDPKDSINEQSFRCCVIKTKDEILKLQKMESAVRKMVNATPQQTTTDAVARIIVSN